MGFRRQIAFVVFAALAAGLAMAVDRPPKKTVRSPLPPETIDQPPAKESPRDDLSARSPAMRVATGPYVSVQPTSPPSRSTR